MAEAGNSPRKPVMVLDKVWEDGVSRPSLVIALDYLWAFLADENAKIAEEDVPGLLAGLCRVAATSGYSSPPDRAARVAAEYRAKAYCGTCECAPCDCGDPPAAIDAPSC